MSYDKIKIAHTADVHIRGLSRHSEYKEVLQAFTQDCKEQRVDHIFVGGDIFHAKTGITPEYVDVLAWWLNEMTKVAPVHLIHGNHDGIVTNLSRQDAVTPVVEALSNPRIHLYKKSGVYEFHQGYNFCVFSIFDEQGWENVKPAEDKVNIACYHGPVRGASTETNWEVEDGLTVEFFNQYDYCFLGDIHKPQFLAYRNDKPWIAYPGPPLQQNYSEQIDHGYLLWSLCGKKWSVNNRQLPNNKPYVTVDWTDNLEKTIAISNSFPRGSRFRIRANTQLTQDDVHKLTEVLKTTKSATEVTFKIDVSLDKKTVSSGMTTVAKSDIRSLDVIVRLLKDFYRDANLSEDDISMITEQVSSYSLSTASVEDTARCSEWSIHHVKWDNLFSYGEGNIVDFSKLNGVVGIFGPNRTGKSSVVGALMYALFNTTDRGPAKNIDICNVRKQYCSATVALSHNGTTYVVERQTTKSTNKKGQVSAPTSLNLFRMNNEGEFDDLCGEQRSDTEKTIRSLLGSADDFLMTSLSSQGETNQFLSQGSTKRRAILSRFLDLDIFDKMYELASKDVNSIKSQLKNYPDRDWSSILENNEKQIASYEEQIKLANEDITSKQATLTLLRDELSKHKASPVSVSDVESQRARVVSLKKRYEECSEKITSLQQEIEEFNDKLKTLNEFVESVDERTLRTKLAAQQKLEKSITELKHAHTRETTLLAQQKKSLKILDEVPCGDVYPSCKFIKDAHEVKTKLHTQENKTNDALAALENASSAYESIKDEDIATKIAKYTKAVDLTSKLTLEISKRETDVERIRNTCSTCCDDLSSAEKQLLILEAAEKNDENVEVVSIRSKIEELSAAICELDAAKIKAASMHGKLLSDIDKLQSEKSSRDQLLKSIRTHELIANAFSKKGLPLSILKSQLPLINSEVAGILHGIVDFTIQLENDEETDSLEIYIDYGDSKRLIELCSGMEKTITAIALRVAMLNVSSLPKPNFFIIDEGFGTLDAANVEACNRFLTSLKRYFKTVIIVSHVDGIKDAADFVIEITKTEKDSKVEFV